jgi:hypothetical protein
MSDTIICTAIRQPPAFYQGAPKYPVAINLNFDSRMPEGNSKDRFAAFLRALPTATFQVFHLVVPPPTPGSPPPAPLPFPTWPFQPAAWTATTDNTPSGATPVDDIMNWLERRGEPSEGTPAPADYWQSAAAPATTDTTFKLGDLKATHHLGTALAWPAPVPQDAGLVRVVTLRPTTTPPDTTSRLIIVPFFAGAPAFKPSKFSQDGTGLLTFIYDAGAGFSQAIAEVRVIDDPVTTASSLVDINNGFLVAPTTAELADVDVVTDLLRQIENRSASMFWAFPAVHAISWTAGAPAAADDNMARLVWRAMNGLATLLDPVVLSLREPLPTTTSPAQQGPFISALASCVESAWPKEMGRQPGTSGIGSYVRAKLDDLLAPKNETDKERRRAIVTLLSGLLKFDIGDPTKLGDPNNLTAQNATNVLCLILSQYVGYVPGSLPAQDFKKLIQDSQDRFGVLEVALSNQLSALAQTLQGEDGIEALVLALLAAIGLFDATGQTLAACTTPHLTNDIAKAAMTAFRTLLAQKFNGLDATRQAQARLYELHLVAATSAKKAKPPGGVAPRWTSQDLKATINDARWFARRIDAAQPSTLQNIGNVLPIYAAAALTSTDHTAMIGMLETSFKAVYAEFVATGTERSFVPDHAPRTLQVQIAVDNDAADLENFAQAYNGVGVLLRRNGGNWAYGDIAKPKIYQKYDPTQPKEHDVYQSVNDPAHPGSKLITVVPLQPVAIDGQRRLFLQYDGYPFTSQAFAKTRVAGTDTDGIQAPFYKYDDPKRVDLVAASFALCPALAYGETYDVSTFVIGSGGSLPLSMQANQLIPWLPAGVTQPPADAGGHTYSRHYVYQRTTAIGRTTLNETPRAGLAKRIGVGIDGVQPLFHDYPRVGLTSPVGGSAVLDVLRNADGTGAFSLAKDGATASISLTDLWWWGPHGASGGTLTLAFFSRPGPLPENAAGHTANDDPLVTIDIPITDAFTDGTAAITVASRFNTTPPNDIGLTFSVQFAGSAYTKPEKPVPNSTEAIWVRVKIIASDLTKTVSLSFADPAAALGGNHVTSHPNSDNLLLIAPVAASSEWRAPYASTVAADIMLPRVGFSDLDRWLNNKTLAGQAQTSVRGQPPSNDDTLRFKQFVPMAMTAHIGRYLNESLGPLLERLPDPAVEQLLVELTPLDALYDKPNNAVALGGVSLIVQLRTLGARLALDSLKNKLGDMTQLVSNLLALSDSCRVGLQIASDDRGKLSITPSTDDVKDAVLAVVVPRGVVARLTIRPMIAASNLEGPVFHPGMATLATEKRGNYYIFEGASMVIESMLGSMANTPQIGPWQDRVDSDNANRCYDWESLVTKAVKVSPAGVHRSYDLVAQPAALAKEPTGWRWRQLANIDIDTQRWRFTGRPIYSRLDPARGAATSVVAIEQNWIDGQTSRRDQINSFEAESFFDRDDADADTQTMRLNPSDATVLQSFPWEQPSATYFRHRLTIRSRYQGALKSGQVAVQRAWGVDREKKDGNPLSSARSWIRVAVLADRTRLQLTRPQLRALIPLTLAPDTADNSPLPPTPPVMAILDERPFAHGGLADRIAAEIRTGLGYELPPDPAVLRIKDARKEFGPDPRLTYTPTPAEEAAALTLRNEGPIGLTFDSDTVRAPVFANTALVLHPTLMTRNSATARSLEEHFLSVGLRRYLDPAWLTGGTTASLAITDTLWIENTSQTFTLGGNRAANPLIKVSLANGFLTVCFDSDQIDAPPALKGAALPPGASPLPPPVDSYRVLCTIQQGVTSGLGFLHLPLEKGRASLSVFAIPPAITGDAAVLAGTSNFPLMMASLEWQVDPNSTNLTFNGGIGQQPSASLTSASPTTLMNWTRTGKNFDIWHAADGAALTPLHVSKVVVRTSGTDCSFVDAANRTLSFEPETGRYPNPLHVHRHHAIVATGQASGIGRPVEVFKAATRYFGGSFAQIKNAQAVRLVEFETPARPLVWLPSVAAANPLKTFTTAHFDVFSVLGNATSVPPGFSIFVRPLGGDAINKTLAQITTTLALTMKSDHSTVSIDLTITNLKPATLLRGLLLSVTTGSLGKVTGQAVYAGGEIRPLNVVTSAQAAPALDTVLAFDLTLSGIKTASGPIAQSEFWTDVSWLTLPLGSNAGDFTFDWFFTGGGTESAAEATTAAALLDMVEAQARIISVSPRISIED